MMLSLPIRTKVYEHPRRDFTPSLTARFGRPTFDPDKLVKYSPKWKYCRLMNFPFRGSWYRPRMKSVVVAVDGGCRGNNRADQNSRGNSRGAWGVYWGPSSFFNRCGTLASSEVQTSSRAELQAVRYALIGFNARRIQGELDGWRELIIKTDSEYVKKNFDQWIWTWEKNGWKKTDGSKVEHLDLIQDIHRMIAEIETNGAVRFWRVGREWNEDADALVSQALDQ